MASMAGEVELAIRRSVGEGDRLPTLTGRGAFQVGELRWDGVVLLLGEKQARTPMSWAALEGVPDFLRGRSWVRVDTRYNVQPVNGTLDAYFKQYIKRGTAGWFAVLLERSGLVEVDRTPPCRVRLR